LERPDDALFRSGDELVIAWLEGRHICRFLAKAKGVEQSMQ
jgi:hypothetical protein